ncbi:MAG: hypothetical protein K5790_06210 [Nitrosopumilus sp.]|uniref:hypothetical protein n=1 Tax=Nitrosopumilus sp. TaxID=2024843 RepID=UPI00247C9157|nr:hypothetical protein [Nitrosopumilus sp.]MCV0392874.1 hypothetical protein [Nitrosopumilus sp.]
MEIKNVTLFFIGIVFLILGSLIIIFDYPQIQFFENMELPTYNLLDANSKQIHQRLTIEYYIGVIFFGLGILSLIVSFLKRFQNRFR